MLNPYIYNHAICKTLGYLECKASLEACPNMSDDHAYSEPWQSQNSLFNHFQEYLGIIRDINAYSATFTGAQLRGREVTSTALLENWKNCPNFRNKGPDCVNLWVNFSIESIFLRVSRKKNSKIFPWGALFSCVFHEMFIEVS